MSAKSSHDTASRTQHRTPERNGESIGACTSFQQAVSEYLIRHRSILDVISKFQEAGARVNRAVVKAVTTCGCVEVQAGRQQLPADITYWEMKQHMATHVKGEMCEHCREVLEQEIGQNMFYLTAICDLFKIELETLLENERKRITALGVFNLT